MASQVQPIYLVSVNNTPLVARKLVEILIEEIRNQLNVVYIANSTTIDGLEPLLLSLVHPPQLLVRHPRIFMLSNHLTKHQDLFKPMTVEQQDKVQRTAKRLLPGIKTVAIPSGLNSTKGGEAVVEFLKEAIIGLGLPSRA